MKNFFFIGITLCVILSVSSCMQTRYITEQHIKTNIEKHEVGESSSIRTYSIFKGNTEGAGRYLELTGYKLGSIKGLVVGADRSYITLKSTNANYARTIETETFIDFIHLSLEESKSILVNYSRLQDKIKKEKQRMNEEVYHDYTVSSDLFISFRKSGGDNGLEYINIWVKGEKYRVSTSLFIKKLTKFIEY